MHRALRWWVGGPRYSIGAGAGAGGWRTWPEVRLQQCLYRARHLLVFLRAVVDSCCGSQVSNELGGGNLLLFGAALLSQFDGFTQDEQDREAGLGAEREVADAQLGVVDFPPTAVVQEVEQAHSHIPVELAPEQVASDISIVTKVALLRLRII